MSQRFVRRRPSRRTALVAALALAAAPVVLTGAAAASANTRAVSTAPAAATTTSPANATGIATATATAVANATGLATASATATTTAAANATGCMITGGTLTWGFKESFRSYISGTIAKGAWEPTGGATYETPNFGWSGPTGEFDPATLMGEVRYPGGVHFTGHDGLLDTTIANPTLQFAGDGSGVLLLDLTSLSMDDAMAGNTENVQIATRVPMVSLDLAAAPLQASADQVAITGTAVPTAITAEGYAAFGSYEAGSAFDPATFSFTVECPEPEPTPSVTSEESGSPEPTPVTASTDEPADPIWLPWVAVGVVAAAIAWAFISLRRSRGADGGGSGSAGRHSGDAGSAGRHAGDAGSAGRHAGDAGSAGRHPGDAGGAGDAGSAGGTPGGNPGRVPDGGSPHGSPRDTARDGSE